MQILRRLPLFLVAASLSFLGCHAQTPAATQGQTVSPELGRRIEVLLRHKANLPPEATIHVGTLTPSTDFPGYNNIAITFTAEGKTSRPINFLVSADGKTMAQMTKFDISGDPKQLVSPEGRPPRGGPADAPVLIVGFDDLECPYCSRMHARIFPAISDRYGDKVRIVYKDFPLPADMHPWAMRAAVDVNCLLPDSPTGYWNLVDYMHAHYSEIGKPKVDPKTVTKDAPEQKATLEQANSDLDRLTLEQAQQQHLDTAKVQACILKQDTTAIQASQKIGEALSVDATPSLFVNGARIDGFVSLAFLFGEIDNALRVQGITPPPPYVDPEATPAVPATPGAPGTQAKPTTTPPAGN